MQQRQCLTSWVLHQQMSSACRAANRSNTSKWCSRVMYFSRTSSLLITVRKISWNELMAARTVEMWKKRMSSSSICCSVLPLGIRSILFSVRCQSACRSECEKCSRVCSLPSVERPRQAMISSSLCRFTLIQQSRLFVVVNQISLIVFSATRRRRCSGCFQILTQSHLATKRIIMKKNGRISRRD